MRLGIPVVALVDTNSDPDPISYIIPGNDDAIRSIKLISSLLADSILEGYQSYLAGQAEALERAQAEKREVAAAAAAAAEAAAQQAAMAEKGVAAELLDPVVDEVEKIIKKKVIKVKGTDAKEAPGKGE